MNSRKLREQRAKLVAQAGELVGEDGKVAAADQDRFDSLHNEADELKAQIDRAERQEHADLELRASQGSVASRQEGASVEHANDEQGAESEQRELSKEERDRRESEMFRRYALRGEHGLTQEDRSIIERRNANLPAEIRAQSVGVDTLGGYTVPPDSRFMSQVEQALKAFGGVRNTRATILQTDNGSDIPMPTSNDTGNKGELLAENTESDEQDITFGSKMLRAYMFSSKQIPVSIQFMQDTAVNPDEFIGAAAGERIARIRAQYTINGTGQNQPEGLAQATVLGKQGASQTAVTYDDFVDMEHSIDPAYRQQAEWLIGDGLLKAAKKLKDGEGRPLWVPGVATREPDTILGYRYAVDQEIPAPTTGAITAYFGDFSKFVIRDVRQVTLLRLVERRAEKLQVVFLAFQRGDSMLLDAGTNPIKHFKQA